MRFSYIIFGVFIFFAVAPVSDAIYSTERVMRLLRRERMRGSPVLLSRKENSITLRVLRKMETDYPECSAHVCFALDGSGSIDDDEWNDQTGFVTLASILVAGVVDQFDNPISKFAAVEYGGRIKIISRLTSSIFPPDPPPHFNFLVDNAESQEAPLTFIAPGMQYCVRQLRRNPAKINKIVLLGDGESNFGDPLGPFGVVRIAERFRNMPGNNDVCGALIKDGNFELFKAIMGGDETKVYRRDRWDQITELLENIIDDICGGDDRPEFVAPI